MDGEDLISVVIATHNMGKYLTYAIQSVLDQTYQNWELIIVDDGSTDGTKDHVLPYLNDPRIRYIVQPHLGQAKAKNRGIEESRGKYIAFLDADDKWVKIKLEKQLPLLKSSTQIGVVYSDVFYIDAEGTIILQETSKTYRQGKVTKYLFKENFVNFNTVLVKRECFSDLGLFDESLVMSIDRDLWLRFSTKYDFAYLDEKLSYYRIWPGQLSRNYELRVQSISQILTKFQKNYPDLLDENTIKEAWAHLYVSRGWLARKLEMNRKKAIKYYCLAIKFYPRYSLIWKEILKLMLPVSLPTLNKFR